MTTHFQAYDPEVSRPLIREKYPRLREEESLILKQYLLETGTESVRRLRTAVPVGDGEVTGQPDNQFQRQVKSLSQMKIDAVVDRPSKQEIIEIKSRATHTAAGQTLFYDLLLGARDDEPTTSRQVVAAFRAHPDFRRTLRKTPVELHLVPSVDPSTATRRALSDRAALIDDDDDRV